MALSAPPVQEEHLPPGKYFRNQLAAAVRSINWSYAVFWSISTSRPGVLTWKDGFYNGEIKTRKITNWTDLTADQLVLQRSEQLRELYESLLSGECDHRARRPVASLSPEDLGDTEWYYMVCMTYVFRPSQGLPGKCFASNEYIWLCNAQSASSKTFPRALLAKSASIQVLENPDLVNRITTSFWEIQFPTCPEEARSSPSANETGEADIVFEDLDHNAMEAMIPGEHEVGEVRCLSNANLEQITKEIDEFYSLCEEMDVRSLEDDWLMDGSFEVLSSPEAAAGAANDVVNISSSDDGFRTSCFSAWKRSSDTDEEVAVPVTRESQKLLKKAVASGAWTNNGAGSTARAQESSFKSHVMSERRRREKLNEMFLILKSLVPSIHKVDKASILAELIAYLKELEQRVEELESNREPSHPAETRGQRHHVITAKKVSGAKRKASSELGASGDVEREHLWALSKDGPSIVDVTVMDKEVLLKVQCQWKELLMTRVFDAIKSLHLDILSVQASTPDDVLALKIRAQFMGSASVAPGMISETLRKAIGKC